jgi:hypothetical protein
LEQASAAFLLVYAALDALQVCLDSLQPYRISDNCRWHLTIEVPAGSAKPFLGQFLVTKDANRPLKHFVVLARA